MLIAKVRQEVLPDCTSDYQRLMLIEFVVMSSDSVTLVLLPKAHTCFISFPNCPNMHLSHHMLGASRTVTFS